MDTPGIDNIDWTELSPVSCLDCPGGFYCHGSKKYECPAGKNTIGTGSTSVDDCLCSAGFYEHNVTRTCEPCADDSIFYKDSIGNNDCDKKCPENSKIPVGIFGAKGPENCVCDAANNFIQTLDLETLEYSCEFDEYGEASKLRRTVKVTAVVTEIYLNFTHDFTVPSDEKMENDDKIKKKSRRLIGSQ